MSSTMVSGLQTYSSAFCSWCTATQSKNAAASARASSRNAGPVTRVTRPRPPLGGRRPSDARSSTSDRHRMTLAGWFMPSTPTTPVVAAVERDEAPLLDRPGHDLDAVVGRRPARPAGSCGRTGPTRTTGSARRAAAAVAGEQRLGGVGAHRDGVVPVLDAHHLVEAPVRPAGHVAGRHHARAPRCRWRRTPRRCRS